MQEYKRPFSFIDINIIHHKDCLNLIDEMPDGFVNAIITDFPYGIDFQSNFREKTPKFEKINNDEEPFIDWIKPSYRILSDEGRLICFYRYDVQDILFKEIRNSGFDIKSQLVWNKGGTGMGDLKAQAAPQHELMVYATKGRYEFKNGRPSSVYSVTKVDGNSMIHPNEKPVRLFQNLINDYSSVGELIFDPFSGSGACSVAAKIERRDFISCDLGESYVKLGNKRVNKESVNLF